MLRLQTLTAFSLRNAIATRAAVSYSSTYRAYSKDSDSDSDDEKPKRPKKSKSQEQKQTEPPKAAEEESAATRLNRLLASMQTDDNISLTKAGIQTARPGAAHKKRKEEIKQQAASKDIYAAAKNVAAMLGGENEESKKQTESELLAKLLGHKADDVSTVQNTDETTKPAEELSLSDLIVGMKIDRRQQPKVQTRAEYVRRNLNDRRQQNQEQYNNNRDGNRKRQTPKREAETYTGSVNLFGSDSLGIFKDPTQLKPSKDILTTWRQLQERELQLQVTHPPTNYFEKMALWTEQGKVWRFPINNEQDWTEEIDVDFSEHIFLEQHLEGWCPTKGPIRHFMELVCVGLSKNPYITAQDKKEHILWYRDYFMAKHDILKDLMDNERLNKNKQTKQLDA